MSAFSFSNAKINIGGVDMSQYIHSATINTVPFTTTQLGTFRYLPDEPVEPAKLSDCPHKPGTIEHRDWIRKHILDCQTDPRTDAYKAEKVRIAGLISDRRVQMDNDFTRRAEALDAMIADLPEPNVDIPPDPPSYLTGVIKIPMTLSDEAIAQMKAIWRSYPIIASKDDPFINVTNC